MERLREEIDRLHARDAIAVRCKETHVACEGGGVARDVDDATAPERDERGDRVERLVWIVPEPRARWDTGDSVLSRYAPACDAVFECVDLSALVAAVRQTL